MYGGTAQPSVPQLLTTHRPGSNPFLTVDIFNPVRDENTLMQTTTIPILTEQTTVIVLSSTMTASNGAATANIFHMLLMLLPTAITFLMTV